MFTQFLDKYLVNDWRKSWKFLSMWFFLILGLSPALYELAVQYDLVKPGRLPEIFSDAINLVAFLGAASRVVDQAAIAKGLRPNKPSGDSG
jgi:hypothetical protein